MSQVRNAPERALIYIVLILVLACSPLPANPGTTSISIFPGAQGFGTDSLAGRGGKIIKVTNLNDDGPGSLRQAIQATGSRIIVFEVGGTVSLSGDLRIINPYVTIAGQTAPSPGITLKNAGIRVLTHDVLVQHLRIRVGDDPDGPNPDNRDAFQILGRQNSTYNVVVDHISASWSIDELVSTWYSVHDVTISNSIIAEALSNSLHSKGRHAMGLLLGDKAENVSVMGNLIAHIHERAPRVKGGVSIIVVNNVMYNIGSGTYMSTGGPAGPNLVSAVGNLFIDGPDTPPAVSGIGVRRDAVVGTKVFHAENLGPATVLINNSPFDPVVSSPPLWHSSLAVRDSSTVESWVLANVGARPADRDAVDERIVSEVKTRTGSIIDSQYEVGGWPNLSKTYRAFPVPDHPNGDDDGDGYTNIEEVLHQMAAQVEGR